MEDLWSQVNLLTDQLSNDTGKKPLHNMTLGLRQEGRLQTLGHATQHTSNRRQGLTLKTGGAAADIRTRNPAYKQQKTRANT